MNYGDEIEVLASGPIIDSKALQPLGITHGSTCWGLWTTGLPTRNKKRQEKNWQIPHLIISPIHPDAWPISIQLRVILRDQRGSLFRFLDAIEPCNVDVQFAECSTAGYDRVVLNSLCTFNDLRNWKTDFLEFYLTSGYQRTLNRVWENSDFIDEQHQGIRDKSEKFPGKVAETPRFIGEIIWALRISDRELKLAAAKRRSSSIDYSEAINEQEPRKLTSDLIRRYAFEWLGRRVLGRLTALWLMVRSKELGLSEDAMAKAHANGRPLLENIDWHLLNAFDMDPPGDYLFPSKSVQTGRRPWNIEIPFAPSWHEDFPDNDDSKLSVLDSLHEQYPSIMAELKDDCSWFDNGEEIVEEVYNKICETLDLIHATRAGNEKPRLTREAILARNAQSPNRWINDVMERILRNNWMHPYATNATYELAHAAIWRQKIDPLEFRYDSRIGQLVSQSGDGLRNGIARFRSRNSDSPVSKRDSLEFPRVAIAAFNTKERFLRLRFIDRETSDTRIVSFEVDFEVSQFIPTSRETSQNQDETNADASDGQPPSSQGLLRQLCKTAGEHSIDLLRVSTRQFSKYPEHHGYPVIEQGTIQLVGRLAKSFGAGDKERFTAIFESALKETGKEVPFRQHIVLRPRVIPWRTSSIFWSSIFNHDRHDEIHSLAVRAGELFGVQLRKAETRTSQATPNICRLIEESDAILQLICLREQDKPKALFSESWQPEYVWMHSEYAIGYALKKPIIRVIDSSMPERIKKEFDKVDRDVPVEYIDLRSSRDTLSAQFEEIISELRSRIRTTGM